MRLNWKRRTSSRGRNYQAHYGRKTITVRYRSAGKTVMKTYRPKSWRYR